MIYSGEHFYPYQDDENEEGRDIRDDIVLFAVDLSEIALIYEVPFLRRMDPEIPESILVLRNGYELQVCRGYKELEKTWNEYIKTTNQTTKHTPNDPTEEKS
jgi:hypothetical protein